MVAASMGLVHEMTERSKQAVITFDREIREDDFEDIRKVFMSIRGVVRVDQLGPDEDRQVITATWRAKAELQDKIQSFLEDLWK